MKKGERLVRKTLNNNDHSQVFWARETENPHQTTVLTKTAGQQPGSGDCCLRSSDWFVKFSEADVKSFSEEQENANTKNKPSYNLKLSEEFLASEEEMRKLYWEIPAAELQEFAVVCARC